MMTKEIKELQRIRSILSYLTGFEDDDQENIEDAFKSVGRVIDSLAEQSAQQKPDINHELTIAYMAGVERGKELAQPTWVGLEQKDMPGGDDPLFDDPKFLAGMVYAANKLMEKNT